ncbi:MAG TPA: efflux RND transporter periplasmic adaptor subunit [Blastocatellia bacterium]|nr:efflux RND transporter periplasmic adaptor subunit [Blastocatellia bacterium]
MAKSDSKAQRLWATSAFAAALATALISLSCGGAKPVTQTEPPAKRVPIETVALSTVNDYYDAVGTVKSKTSSVLSPKVLGTIIAVYSKEGDRVRAGQLLIEMDSREVEAQLDKARAAQREAQDGVDEIDRSSAAAAAALNSAQTGRNLAEATYKRYKILLERKSVSPQEFDEVETRYKAAGAEVDRASAFLDSLKARKGQAQARIEQAEAEVNAAQVTVGYFRIASPMEGTVTAKQAEPGATAAPGAPLLTIEDDSHYLLEAAVEDSQSGKIKIGDNVEVLFEGSQPSGLIGKVQDIVHASDPLSRSFTVKVDLPSTGHETVQRLRSGLYGKARFEVGRRETITVPSSAIVERGQLTGVYAVDGSGRALLRLIKTGNRFGDKVEVLSGLAKGDRIVTAETSSIAEGRKVISAAEPASARNDR